MSSAARADRIERQVGEAIRERRTGILTIQFDKVRRLFCLDRGRLVHAASNIIEEQFEEFLVRERHLAPGDRARAKLETAKSGGHALAWLLDQGLLERDTYDELLREHSTTLFFAALAAEASEIEFQAGRANLEGKPVTDIALAGLLLEFLRTHPADASDLPVRIGKPGVCMVRVDDAQEFVAELEAEHPGVQSVWNLADGQFTVSALCAEASGGDEAALRKLYGLLLVGALEEGAEELPASGAAKRHTPVTRNELQARLDRTIDASHYSVLELMPGADSDQIRNSYYMLAQRYHPDRFRSGDLTDLLPRIEVFFSQVTEAYNTLNNPELRANYDEELEQLDSRARVQDPEHDAGHLARQNFTRARALVQRNQFHQAVTFFENAIKLQENVPEFHVELGRVLTRNPRQRDEAEEHLRRGIELDPTVIDGHFALADLLVKRDKTEQAIRVLKEGLNWHPDHPELTKRLTDLGAGKSRGLFGR